jgi:hypothetical protein
MAGLLENRLTFVESKVTQATPSLPKNYAGWATGLAQIWMQIFLKWIIFGCHSTPHRQNSTMS